jgi:RNA polymerase sigma-70 factor (ECF subfamily)
MASITAESNGTSEHTEALYRAHGAAVAALCRSLLRDRGEAEDATQQVFLSAHRALLNGTVPREPLAWLLTVARNECYARFRERAATPVPAGEAADGATVDASVHVLRAGELATMWDEVGRMPQAQRDAFLLREIRGLSYGQLATELSLSAASVRSLLLRARGRLRNRLGDVAAGLGGAQWVQALLRIAGGGDGDGPSPVPVAAKATAVGLGALALVGGGSVQRAVHHASTPHARPAMHHRAEAHSRRVAFVAPVAAAPAPREDRSSGHSHRRHDGSRGSGSHGGSDDTVVSALGGTAESGDDGSPSTTTSGSASSGSGSGDTTTTTTTATSTESGSDSVTTTTTSTSSGSGGSGRDSSGSSGSGSSDGGSSHDGGGSGSDRKAGRDFSAPNVSSWVKTAYAGAVAQTRPRRNDR